MPSNQVDDTSNEMLHPMEEAKYAGIEYRDSPWKIRVNLKMQDLRNRLSSLGCSSEVEHLKRELDTTELALGQNMWGWNRFTDWWSGRTIEYVWQSVHMVERELLKLVPDEELLSHLDDYVNRAANYLPKDDPCLVKLQTPREIPVEGIARDAINRTRTELLILVKKHHRASDELHESVRSLRNRLLAISVATTVAEVVGVIIQYRCKNLPLIAMPSDLEGKHVQPWTLLSLVMLAGGLGGFITALPSMITSTSGALAYKLPFQQALLKLAIGPLMGAAGIMLFFGGFAGTTGQVVQTTAQVLAAALVFGAGQQTVTGFADRKAVSLLRDAGSV